MSKEEDIKSDELDDWEGDIDSDDFDFDMDIDDFREPAKTNKGVVTDQLRAASTGVGESIMGEVGSSFPKIKDVISGGINIAGDANRLKDEFVKDITPTITSLKVAGTRLLPRVKHIAPESLYKKLEGFFETRDSGKLDARAELEKQRNETISSVSEAIFSVQAKIEDEKNKDTTVEKFIDRGLAASRHEESTTITAKMQRDIAFGTEFTKGPLTGYLKKSLELKYKHLFVAQDTLQNTIIISKLLENKLESIKHNTGLPDIQKEKFGEVINATRRKMIGESFNEFIGSFVTKSLSNVKTRVLDNIKEGLDSLSGMAEMLVVAADMEESMSDGNDDKKAKLSSNLGIGSGLLGNFAGSKIGSKIVSKFGGHFRETDGSFDNFGTNLVMKLMDFKREKEDEGGILGTLLSFLPEYQQMSLDNPLVEDGDQPAVFDLSTRAAIVEIIPGYLSKILKQVTDFRTGDDNEELIYDVTKRDFLNKSDVITNLNEVIFGNDSNKATDIDKAVGDMRGAYSINRNTEDTSKFDDKIQDLRKLISNHVVNKRMLDVEKINEFVTYEGKGYPNEYIKKTFTGIEDPQTLANILQDVIYDKDDNPNDAVIQEFNDSILGGFNSETYQKLLGPIIDTHGYRRLYGDLFKDGKLQTDKISDVLIDTDEKETYSYIGSASNDFIDQYRRNLEDLQNSDKEIDESLVDVEGVAKTVANTFVDGLNMVASPNLIGGISRSISPDNFSIDEIFDKEDSDSTRNKIKRAVAISKQYKDNREEIYKQIKDRKLKDDDAYFSKYTNENEHILDLSSDDIISDTPNKKPNSKKDESENIVLRDVRLNLPLPLPVTIDNVSSIFESRKEVNTDGTKKKEDHQLSILDEIKNSTKKIVSFNDDFIAYTKEKVQIDGKLLDMFSANLSIVAGGALTDEQYKKIKSSIGSGLFSSTLKGIGGIGSSIFKTVSSVTRSTYDMASSNAGKVFNMGESLFSGLKTGMTTAATGLFGKTQKLSDAEVSTLKEIINNTEGKFTDDEKEQAMTLLIKGRDRVKGLFEQGLSGVTSFYGTIGSGIYNMLSSKKEPFCDVYLKDKIVPGKPILSRRKQEKGVIFVDGTKLEKTSEITEPVLDPDTKDALITEDDINIGLVDINNKPINSLDKSFISSLWNGAKNMLSNGVGFVKDKVLTTDNPFVQMYIDMTKSIFEFGKDRVKDIGNFIGNLFGGGEYGYDSRFTRKDAEEVLGERLDVIIGILTDGDYTHSKDSNEKHTSITQSIKDTITNKKDNIKDRIKNKYTTTKDSIQETVDETIGSIKDTKVGKQINNIQESVYALKDAIVKPKVKGDNDGDGDRDNSYRDRMENKKDTLKDKIVNGDHGTGNKTSGVGVGTSAAMIGSSLSGIKKQLSENEDAIEDNKEGFWDNIMDGGLAALGTAALAKLGIGAATSGGAAAAGTGIGASIMGGLGTLATGTVGTIGTIAGGLAAGVLAIGGTIASAPLLSAAAIAALGTGAYLYFSDDMSDAEEVLLNVKLPLYGDNLDIDTIYALEQVTLKILQKERGPLTNDELFSYVEDMGLDASDPKQVAYFNSWYKKRFMLIFSMYLNALSNLKLTPEKLSELEEDSKPVVSIASYLKSKGSSILSDRGLLELSPNRKRFERSIDNSEDRKESKAFREKHKDWLKPEEGKEDLHKEKEDGFWNNVKNFFNNETDDGRKIPTSKLSLDTGVGLESNTEEDSTPSIKDRVMDGVKTHAGNIYEKVKSWIKGHEGLSLYNYKDSRGYNTIGYGHLNKEGYVKLDRKEAEDLFEYDFAKHLEEAKRIPEFNMLDPVRQGSLLDMTFNMGAPKVMNFKNARAHMRDGNYIDAKREILDSAYAEQVGSRAEEVATVMETGDPADIKPKRITQYGKGKKVVGSIANTWESTIPDKIKRDTEDPTKSTADNIIDKGLPSDTEGDILAKDDSKTDEVADMFGDFEAHTVKVTDTLKGKVNKPLLATPDLPNRTTSVKDRVRKPKPSGLESELAKLHEAYVKQWGEDYKSDKNVYSSYYAKRNKLIKKYEDKGVANADELRAALNGDQNSKVSTQAMYDDLDDIFGTPGKKKNIKPTNPYKSDKKTKEELTKAKKDKELQNIVVEDKHGKEQVDGLNTIASGIESLKEAFFSIFGDGRVFNDIKANLDKQLEKDPVNIVQNNEPAQSTNRGSKKPLTTSSPTINVYKSQYRSS